MLTRLFITLGFVVLLVGSAASQRFLHPPARVGSESGGGGGGGGEGGVVTTQTVFLDQCTVSSDTNLASKTPNTGTAWVEDVDTQGSLTLYCGASSDAARASAGAASHRLLYRATPSPTIADQNYNHSAVVERFDGDSDDPMVLWFGGVDTSNYCAVVIYPASAATDLYLVQVVAGTATDITSANADVAVGQTVGIEARGSAITITKNGTLVASASDGDCDNGTRAGIGLGNVRTSTDDISTVNRWDDVTTVQVGTAAGIAPLITRTTPEASPYNTASANVVIAGTAAAGSAALSAVDVDCTGATTITNQAATGTTSWTTTVAVNVGTTDCTATVTDAGALTATTAPLTIVRDAAADSTRPTLAWTFPAASPYAAGLTENPLTLTVQCMDNIGCTTATWVNNQGGGGTCTMPPVVATSVSVECGPVALASANVTNTITLTACDAAGNCANVGTTRQITHIADLIVTTTVLPNATQNAAYGNRQLVSSGGVGTVTWATVTGATFADDAQCAGFALSAAGVVSGTPTQTGACNFTVRATDSQGSPDTDDQALQITIAAATAETGNSYFTAQIARSRCNDTTNEGTNCIVEIDDCYDVVPADNGACSLRNHAQVVAINQHRQTGSERPSSVVEPDYWNYIYGSDSYSNPQDGAKQIIPAGDTDPLSQMILSFGATTFTSGQSMTIVHDVWWGNEWRPDGCGGGAGTGQKFIKTHRFDLTGLAGGPAAIFNPKMNIARVQDLNEVPCSQNAVARLIGGVAGNMSNPNQDVNKGEGTTVAPALVGQTGGDSKLTPSGDGTFVSPDVPTNYYTDFLLKASTWHRYIYHVTFGVPGNSSLFASWRADCDNIGVTTTDGICANMLSTLGDADSDCAVEDAANCGILYTHVSMWVCDETRGCERMFYGVPWQNYNRVNLFRVEYDSSQVSCVGCVDRTMYERNVILIRNIDASDIDDTGCPSACPGDSGAVSTNVFRKPVR